MTNCWAIRSTTERMCEVRNTVTPRAAMVSQQIAHDPGGDRVDGFERLIQEQRLGIRQQCHGERGLLAHAVGAVARESVAALGQAQGAQKLLDRACAWLAVEPVDWPVSGGARRR